MVLNLLNAKRLYIAGPLQAIFFTFGYMSQARAPILAEMLGFDPSLVIPQLLLQIQAAEQAERLQQRQQQQQQQ